MSDEPFVLGKQQPVLMDYTFHRRKIGIGSLGQDNHTAETAVIYLTGRIVQVGGIHLDHRTCRNQACFRQAGIVSIIRLNILLTADQQHQVGDCHIDLGSPVVLQSI